MKCLCIAVLLFVSINLCAVEYVYYASGDQISVKRLDPASGKLLDHQTVDHKGAGPFTFSPDESKMYIIANLGKGKLELSTYAVAKDAKIKFLKKAPVSKRPADMTTDRAGNYLFGNHYREGI